MLSGLLHKDWELGIGETSRQVDKGTGHSPCSLSPALLLHLYVLAGIRFSITRTTSANPTVITRYRYATTLYVSKNRNVLAE